MKCGGKALSARDPFAHKYQYSHTFYDIITAISFPKCLKDRHILFDISPHSSYPSSMIISLSEDHLSFTGPGGSLLVPDDDEICRRLAMLLEGQCEQLGPSKAAQKYGFTRQRYYQILADFYKEGAEGLLLQTPGPKSDYRRTADIIKLVVRCRYLDRDSSAAVIAQKIRQQHLAISTRSVERIIAD